MGSSSLTEQGKSTLFNMKSVALLTLFFVTFGATLPVDDPNDDVELVPIENTNQGDPELSGVGGGGDFVPVIVIRTSNSPFGGSGGSFGGFGGGMGGFPSLFNNFFGSAAGGSDSLVPDIDPKDFLEEKEEEEGEKECDGLLCLLFKALGTRVKHIEDEIKEIQENRKNEVEEGGEREPETTYEEKVLEDGTVVKINRTRYSDVSDDGTSYFGFHSTSFVSGGDDDDDDNKEEADNTEVDAKVAEEMTTEAATAAEAADDKDEEDKNPIKLVRQNSGNVRRRRSDPFNQQTVDASFLNEIRQEKLQQPWKQHRTEDVRSLAGDTRVNALLLENARRGGYVRTDPDAEFINGDESFQ